MSDETYTVCPGCNKRVEPGDVTVEYGVKMENHPGFGQDSNWIEGIGGFFHAGHLSRAPGHWRPKTKPDVAAAS